MYPKCWIPRYGRSQTGHNIFAHNSKLLYTRHCALSLLGECLSCCPLGFLAASVYLFLATSRHFHSHTTHTPLLRKISSLPYVRFIIRWLLITQFHLKMSFPNSCIYFDWKAAITPTGFKAVYNNTYGRNITPAQIMHSRQKTEFGKEQHWVRKQTEN